MSAPTSSRVPRTASLSQDFAYLLGQLALWPRASPCGVALVRPTALQPLGTLRQACCCQQAGCPGLSLEHLLLLLLGLLAGGLQVRLATAEEGGVGGAQLHCGVACPCSTGT